MVFFDKLKETVAGSMEKAKQKLAYSEEEIQERKKKDGIVYVFDGGIITQEEFDAKKKQILGL